MSNPATAYTYISVCSGIGGFDLAMDYAGFEGVCQIENNPFCIKVLEKHWPGTYRIKDLNDAAENPSTVPAATALVGGIPCQPFSTAGKRRGKSDDRYLLASNSYAHTSATPQGCHH